MHHVVLVLSLAVLLSCAGPPRSPGIPPVVVPEVHVHGAAASTAVGSIRIANASVLLADQTERLEAYGTRQRLQNELMKQLVAAGRFGEGGELQLSLEITAFRLEHSRASSGGE